MVLHSVLHRAARERWVWNLICLVSSGSELELEVLDEELSEAHKDIRAALDIREMFC